jgi:SAM-dependent methyltransferase
MKLDSEENTPVCAVNYEDELWALIYDQYNQGRHQKELSFYATELSDCDGPVLEIACGTGMILLKLLLQGLDIYGFDISEEMLRVLRSKATTLEINDIHTRVSRQDMRDFHYECSFDGIIIPARSFLHLTKQADQIACLRTVYAHLRSGGRLLLNFFNPRLDFILERAGSDAEYRPLSTFAHPVTGEPIELSRKQANDIHGQVQSITWRFKYREVMHETSMSVRWIYREEFKLLLRLAGFVKWDLYGDFDKSEFNSDSGEMIWVAEK